MLLASLVIGVAVVSFMLALTVLLRNARSSYNLSFAIFAALLSFWIPANFFGSYQSANPHLSFLFFMDFTVAPLMAFAFSVFGFEALRFYHQKSGEINKLILFLGGSVAVFMSLGAALHHVATPIYSPNNVLSAKGVLYYPYNITVAIMALLGLATLFYATINAKEEYKPQTRLALIGLTAGSILLIAANIVFPEVKPAQDLSYFALLVMLFSLSYSIVHHRLFDIRLIIARSVGYILVLLSLGVSFAAAALVLTTLLFHGEHIGVGVKATYAALALAVAFAFQPLRRFFDKLSNSLFYRDAYDTQELLNNLNRSLVTTIELEDLLNRSADVISQTIKAEYCAFAIKGEQGQALRLIGGSYHHDDQVLKDVQHITAAVAQLPDKIVVADELESNKQHLRELMRSADISILAKLEGRTKGRGQHPGYIFLGQKRSGGLYSPQDIRVLEIIADELVIAIQNSLRFEEIKQFNITLRQKIDEATKELQRVNVRLREADKTKDEFISMASHQLRTPLTTIKGYLSLILEGDAGPVKKQQKEMMQRAFGGAQKMVYLIADMLNVSRLQTGKFVIENQPTNLAKLVEEEVSQLQENAEEHQVKLIYHKPVKFPQLNLDNNKIRQVVMNFLDNAIYYTLAKGTVTADLNATDSQVAFTVTDTGMGVPPAVQHHLFSKFYRADNARKVRPDGTGLGLFMAKKVVAAQGGAIIFKSIEGKGSTFGFSFPRAALEASPAKKPVLDKEAVALAKT